MRPTLIVLCTLAVAGCTAQPAPPPQLSSDQRLQQMTDKIVDDAKAQESKYQQALQAAQQAWDPLFIKYRECNTAAATAIASQEGDPVSLAVAARGMCMRAEADMLKVMDAAYIAAGPDAWEVRNYAIATARKTALERNAAVIAAVRARKAATSSSPTKPPQAHDF